MKRLRIIFASAALCLVLVSQGPRARAADAKSNAVTVGEFVIDPPTLINLGFEWMIQGDDNRNAAVAVSYRKKGESQWRQGMPLLRLQNEEIFQGDRLDVVSPNMFAGSILDLEPDTEYEARFLTLTAEPSTFIRMASKGPRSSLLSRVCCAPII